MNLSITKIDSGEKYAENSVFSMNAFMQKGIERAFTYLGMEYDTFYYIFKDWDKDDDFKEKLKKGCNLEKKNTNMFFR